MAARGAITRSLRLCSAALGIDLACRTFLALEDREQLMNNTQDGRSIIAHHRLQSTAIESQKLRPKSRQSPLIGVFLNPAL